MSSLRERGRQRVRHGLLAPCSPFAGRRVCWRHGGRLLSSCRPCRQPFQFRASLLRQPSHACQCGWDVAGAEDKSASDMRAMLEYARFAHALLNYPLGQIDRLRLRAAYQNRIREFGFAWGSHVQVTKERMLAPLPVSLADTPRHSERYPTHAQAGYRQPRVNVALQGKAVVVGICRAERTGDAPPMVEAVVLSGVGPYAAQAIIEHCGWEHLLPLAANIDVLKKLSGAGITKKWDAPCVAKSGYRGPGISTSEVRRIESHQARQSVPTPLTENACAVPPSTRSRSLLSLNRVSINEMHRI